MCVCVCVCVGPVCVCVCGACVCVCVCVELRAEAELPQCVLLVNVLSHLPSHPEEALQLWYSGSQFPEDTPR